MNELFRKTDILEAIVVTRDDELSKRRPCLIARRGREEPLHLPSSIMRYLYPLEGNESVLGDNVFSDPYRKVDAQLAVDTKKITLSDLDELTQGGARLWACASVPAVERCRRMRVLPAHEPAQVDAPSMVPSEGSCATYCRYC